MFLLTHLYSNSVLPPQRFLFSFLCFPSFFPQAIGRICDLFWMPSLWLCQLFYPAVGKSTQFLPGGPRELCAPAVCVLFWELRKCNYMLRSLTSLTHLLISSCQLSPLYSRSSPAPGACQGSFGRFPGRCQLCLSRLRFSLLLLHHCTRLRTLKLLMANMWLSLSFSSFS